MRPRHAVLALAGLAIAAFALRPQVVGVGPILERIRDDLGMSHGAAGLLATIPVLCMGIFAPPAAYPRRGCGRAVTVALLLIGFGGLLRAVARAFLLILLTIPIGIGMGMGNRADAGRREGALRVAGPARDEHLRRRHPDRRHRGGSAGRPARRPRLRR